MANDVIEQAVIETNREIAAEAWDQEHVELDHTGDRTPESMGDGLEGQHEDEEAEETEETEEVEAAEPEGEEAEEAEPEPKPDAEPPKPAVREPEGRVPSARLREATEKSRALETERDALKAQLETSNTNSRAEVAALNARLDGVLAAIRQQPKAEPTKPVAETIPDMFEDPKGYHDYLTKGFQNELNQRDQRMENLRVETSMQVAHAIHKEAFAKGFEALTKLNPQNPDDQVTVRRIYSSPNPGEALVQWHKRSETLREVGDDPAKYREKVAADVRTSLMADPEFRKQLIADLQAEANGNGKPNTITRLPKSLNGAPGGSRAGAASDDFDGSAQAVADAAWR